MGGSVLTKASKLFRAGKFSELIHLLEPQVFQFRENSQFYYYLGISCLYTGDIGGAHSFLQRATQLKRDDIYSHLGLAAVYIRRRDSAEAIRHYLKVLELNRKNRKAQRGLDLIRKSSEEQDLYDLSHSRQFNSLLPSTGFYIPGLVPVAVTGAAVFLLAFLISTEFLGTILNLNRNERPEIQNITIEKEEDLVAGGGSSRYILTEKEILSHFESAKNFFNDFDYNNVQKHINILVQSNASQTIKDKMTYIEGLLETPDFTSLKTNFTYREVVTDPKVFQDCFVIWKGKISNLTVQSERITFDLLIGYEMEKVLEGIVPVTLGFAADLDPDIPVEILARVSISEGSIMLIGTGIHPILP